ncbi:hypothetical protein LSH36_111g03036 [Paralvinella palmiformis]|uniref:Uncharacterized protein n=1 Tax=Paralvinella palmiformis TaxID=53620 RepID=A0AAD9JZ33_9ANNE|nr:hypothetical protein LSH36_111g03036 [Paralvinella palmiformis]
MNPTESMDNSRGVRPTDFSYPDSERHASNTAKLGDGIPTGRVQTIDGPTDGRTIELMSINEYLGHIRKLNRIKRKRKSSAAGDGRTGLSTFANRVVTHFGEYRAAVESNVQEVATCVEQLVQQLLKAVVAKDARFVGRLRSCASYLDGLKLQHPNEYNYLLELSPASLRFDDLQWANVVPETLTPRTEPNVYGRCYFKASFRGSVPPVWRCPSCIVDQCGDCQHRQELNPRRVQEDFVDAVKAAVVWLNPDWSNAEISCSGSALTIYSKIDAAVASRGLLNRHGLKKVRQHPDVGFFIVRIRITLAIPVEKANPAMRWPLEGYGDMELDPEICGPCADIRKCHLVVAGDYWRVSFDHLERKLLRKLTEDPGKRKCLRAIKYLRDHVGIADPSRDSSLTTHSLILSFFKENSRQDKEEKWRFWSLSERVRNMLGNVEQRKAVSYVVNDVVAPLECEQLAADFRRITRYLDKLDRLYEINGGVHFAMMALLFVCHLLLFCLSATYLGPIKQQQPASCVAPSSSQLHVGSYGHLHLPLSLASVIISVSGMVWIGIQRKLVHSYSVLYDMYRAILYAYIILTALDALLVGFGVGLAVLIDGFYASRCLSWPSSAATGLTLCTLCLTAFVVLAMVGHLIFYAVEAFPCLRRNTRDPPRVSVSVNKKESVADDTDTDSDSDVIDRALSTLERKRRRESPRTAASFSPRCEDDYDCYQGRFNPISPMQSVARHCGGSAGGSVPHSPAYLGPYGDSDLGSSPLAGQWQGYADRVANKQSPLASPGSTYGGMPDYPEPILAAPADILDLSYQSSLSRSSTPKPENSVVRNGGSFIRKPEDTCSSQILDPRSLDGSYDPIPLNNTSTSEPCLSAPYCLTDGSSGGGINNTTTSKQCCRFIDVAI